MTYPVCHPERNEMKSRDLRTKDLHNGRVMRRSLDSLTLPRDDMTGRWMLKPLPYKAV